MSGLDARREPSSPGPPSLPRVPPSPRMPPSLRRDEEDEEPEEPPVQARRNTMSVSGQPLVQGGYEGMRCAGCDQAFGPRGVRTKITPGGVGMIHNKRVCLDQGSMAPGAGTLGRAVKFMAL